MKKIEEVEEFLTKLRTLFEKMKTSMIYEGLDFNEEIVIKVPEGAHVIAYFFKDGIYGLTAITYRDRPNEIISVH